MRIGKEMCERKAYPHRVYRDKNPVTCERGLRTMPNVSAYRADYLDYLFEEVTPIGRVYLKTDKENGPILG